MRSKVQITRDSGESLTFDSWAEGTFEGSAIISDHPIEDGSRTSDHSQSEPLQITLTVRQTETPLDSDDGPFGPERIQEAMLFLEEIGRSGEEIEVVIPRVDFVGDLVLSRWPNTITSALSSEFEIVLREIETAVAEIVSVPVEAIAPPARARHQEETDRGTQATEETEEDAGGIFGGLFGGADESLLSRIL